MAIPGWTWESESDVLAESLQPTALEPVSETFGVLSDPNRLQILLVLARADTPVAYSTLREAVDIRDKGRFNYHVRQLRGEFIEQDEEGYALTEDGRAFVRTALTDADRFTG